MAEIPFWIHDRPKWVSGISRHTTCQDVLFALVKTERKSKSSSTKDESSEDGACKEISRQLAVVEQWRGVERPLSNTSKIFKLWQAWGEERKDVKFVVKRISSSKSEGTPIVTIPSVVTSDPGSLSTLGRARKPRRRTSRASSIASQGHHGHGAAGSHSEYKKTDTIHPNALKNRPNTNGKLKNHDIERLMRIILAQGETIHNQLKKLQEREGQIESIEEKVHDTRTRTAGKDYLLNSYLKYLPESQATNAEVSCGSDRSSLGDALETLPDRLQEMLDTLTKVTSLNEEIHKAEEKISDLRCQLDVSDQSGGPGLETARAELKELRGLNNDCGKEIDSNRQKISLLREAVETRQAVIFRLERDMGTAEIEGKQLELQLQAIEERRQNTLELLQRMSLTESNLEDELDGGEVGVGEEQIVFPGDIFPKQNTFAKQASNLGGSHFRLNRHFLNDGHFRISNEELYFENHVASPSMTTVLTKNPRMLYEQLQRQTQYTLPASDLEELQLLSDQPPGCSTDASRSVVTGSPGSASSSGNSSGSGGGGSEKSVRFSDRDTVLSTPELPTDPPCGRGGSAVELQSASKSSVKKSLSDPMGDTDSNSDTGLSSLHSSSDEGTYILDTLV